MASKIQEKLTPQAHQTLAFAHEEAQNFNHKYIGDEHILLGLVRARGSAAGKLLWRLGLEIELARSMVGRLTDDNKQGTSKTPALATSTEQIFKNAAEKATRAGHNQVGTGHLLLAIADENDSIAMRTLDHFGISSERLQSYIVELTEGVN
jgi:ATP-dependent Clp protease ATP-binding subunit ClpC